MDHFEELYQIWPKKGDKANTRLAFDFVYNKFDYSGPDYLKAAQLWQFKASHFQRENQTLANWLRDEKFVPELSEIKSSDGIKNALDHAQMFKDAALVVIGEWNRLRMPWWSKVEDFEGRSYLCETALRSEFFQNNWKKALGRATRIFKYPARDSIGKIILTPSIEWFCDLKENVVAKILEGDYGLPDPKTVIPNYERTKFNSDEKKEIGQLFEEAKLGILEKKVVIIEGPWKVICKIHCYQMMYKGAVIKEEKMPYKAADQDALYRTLVNQANNFNNINYEPSLPL